jgi:DNA-binding NtrC family response regulator
MGARPFQSFPPELADLREDVLRVARQDTAVLLRGEPGTGKTYLERCLHELSPRQDQPFLVINCGALSPTLIAREMFGDTAGAVHGADRAPWQVRGGRPRDARPRCHRLLAAGGARQVGAGAGGALLRTRRLGRGRALLARVLALSSAGLEEVAAERLRPDLYARLSAVRLSLAPLRDRRSSVGPLSEQWLAEFAARHRPGVQGIHPRALRALGAYHWPGTVRQLRNVLERAVPSARGHWSSLAICPRQSANQAADSTSPKRGSAVAANTVTLWRKALGVEGWTGTEGARQLVRA